MFIKCAITILNSCFPVESITANDTVSICRVEYKSKGPSIPCGDTPVTTNPTDLITEIGDNHTSLAQMSMIGVTSTGK